MEIAYWLTDYSVEAMVSSYKISKWWVIENENDTTGNTCTISLLSTVTIIMVVLAFSVFILLFSFHTLSIYYIKNAILFKAGTYMLLEIQNIHFKKRVITFDMGRLCFKKLNWLPNCDVVSKSIPWQFCRRLRFLLNNYHEMKYLDHIWIYTQTEYSYQNLFVLFITMI